MTRNIPARTNPCPSPAWAPGAPSTLPRSALARR